MPYNYPISYQINAGVYSSGVLDDLFLDNDTRLIIDETPTDPGFDIELWFEGVPDLNHRIHVNGYYDGNPAHIVKGRLWNYTQSQWDDLTANVRDFPSRADDADYYFELNGFDSADYLNSGQLRFQIVHDWHGSALHTLNLDQVNLVVFSSSSSSSSSSSRSSSSSSLSSSSSSSQSSSSSSSSWSYSSSSSSSSSSTFVTPIPKEIFDGNSFITRQINLESPIVKIVDGDSFITKVVSKDSKLNG